MKLTKDLIWWLFIGLLSIAGIIIAQSIVSRAIFGCTLSLILCRVFIRGPKWRFSLMGVFTAAALGLLIYTMIKGL